MELNSALPERPWTATTGSISQQPFLKLPSDNVEPLPDPGTSQHSSSGSRNHSPNSAAMSDQQLQFPEPPQNAIHRQISNTSSLHPSAASTNRQASSELSPSWGEQTQTPAHWVERKLHIHVSHRDGAGNGSSAYWQDEYEDEEGDWGDEEEEEEDVEVNEISFFQPAFVSEVALQLKYRVQRRRQTKAGIAWVGSFTGRDIVVRSQPQHLGCADCVIDNHTRSTPRLYAQLLVRPPLRPHHGSIPSRPALVCRSRLG